MVNHRFRTPFVVVIASIAMMSPSAALGQTSIAAQAYASAPADNLATTEGGVDMRSGRYQFKKTDVSVGPEDGGIMLTRLPRSGPREHLLPFGNFTHNFDMYIVEKRTDYLKGNFNHVHGLDYRIMVRFGERSDTFDGEANKTSFGTTSKGPISWLTYSGDRNGAGVIYTYRATDGTIATFRPLGNGDCGTYMRCSFISNIAMPDGTRLDFSYDQITAGGGTQSRLRSVVSSRGYALVFEYAGSLITKACAINLGVVAKPSGNTCPSGAAMTSLYSYAPLAGGNGLTTMTDNANAVWSYIYGNVSGQSTIGYLDPGATTPRLVNIYGTFDTEDDVYDVIYSQGFADGRSYNYEYTDTSGLTFGTIQQVAGGVMTDAQGKQVSVLYGLPRFPKELVPGYDPNQPEMLPPPGSEGPDAPPPGSGTYPIYQLTPGPVKIIDKLGQETNYNYCDPAVAAGLPASAQDRCLVLKLQNYVDPEGAKTDVLLADNALVSRAIRHPKPGSGLADITLSVNYICSPTSNQCTKPTSTVDARQNTTNFGYTTSGALAWALDPPAYSGAPRALTRYDYAQKFAYVRNEGGTLGPAASAIWMPTSKTVCQTVAGFGDGAPSETPACDPSMLTVVTTYQYGDDGTPNNLLVRGQTVTAEGVVRRTCYGYDEQARRISETTPRAGRTTCL